MTSIGWPVVALPPSPSYFGKHFYSGNLFDKLSESVSVVVLYIIRECKCGSSLYYQRV